MVANRYGQAEYAAFLVRQENPMLQWLGVLPIDNSSDSLATGQAYYGKRRRNYSRRLETFFLAAGVGGFVGWKGHIPAWHCDKYTFSQSWAAQTLYIKLCINAAVRRLTWHIVSIIVEKACLWALAAPLEQMMALLDY
jgi:hypothetical protein